MKIIIIMVALISTLFGSIFDWSNDYDDALEQAEKENKQVYMLITSENCRWCRKFEDTTLQDASTLKKLRSKYVLLHITRDQDYLPEKFEKKRVPRHYFITQKGEVIYSFLGYWNVEDFDSFLNDADRKYKEKFKGK